MKIQIKYIANHNVYILKLFKYLEKNLFIIFII